MGFPTSCSFSEWLMEHSTDERHTKALSPPATTEAQEWDELACDEESESQSLAEWDHAQLDKQQECGVHQRSNSGSELPTPSQPIPVRGSKRHHLDVSPLHTGMRHHVKRSRSPLPQRFSALAEEADEETAEEERRALEAGTRRRRSEEGAGRSRPPLPPAHPQPEVTRAAAYAAAVMDKPQQERAPLLRSQLFVRTESFEFELETAEDEDFAPTPSLLSAAPSLNLQGIPETVPEEPELNLRCNGDEDDLACNEEEEDSLMAAEESRLVSRLGSLGSGSGGESPLRTGGPPPPANEYEYESPTRIPRRMLTFSSAGRAEESSRSPSPPSFPGRRSPCITPQDQLLRDLLTSPCKPRPTRTARTPSPVRRNLAARLMAGARTPDSPVVI